MRRSTRRRQDAPNLPRRPVEDRTVGRVFGGKYRPSTFLTLTLDSYGRVDMNGAGRRPGHLQLPARGAGRDPLPQAARSVLAERPPLRRLGRAVLRHRRTTETRRPALPRRHPRHHPPRRTARDHRGHVSPGVVATPRHDPLQRREAAALGQPAQGLRRPRHPRPTPGLGAGHRPGRPGGSGAHGDVRAAGPRQGVLGGTEEAGRHIGYLTKYLTKSVGQAAGLDETATERQREHARRLAAELAVTPCSPRCPIWLLYGVEPKGARPSTVPGHCRGKAHKPEHLGIAGRRVLVSRKWSNKSLADHRAERTAFVRQLLNKAGVRPGYAVDDGPFEWETTQPGDTDVPSRPVLLLHAIHQRQRWRADYDAAVLATDEAPPDDRSATDDHAA